MAKKHNNNNNNKAAPTTANNNNNKTKASDVKAKAPKVEQVQVHYHFTPNDKAVKDTATDFEKLGIHQLLPSGVKCFRDDVRGRFLQACEVLPAGTTVLSNQLPFCNALFDAWTTKACAACNKIFDNKDQPIQCRNCLVSHYCSRTCFNNSGNYHPYECKAIGCLKDLKMQGEMAPIRAIIKALVIKNLQDTYAKEQSLPISKRNKMLVQYKPTPGYAWADIAPLLSHYDKIDSQTTVQLSGIFKIIGVNSGLTWWDGETTLQAVQLYLQLLVNQQQLKDPKNISTPIGLGLYHSISLINHSCSPNCHLIYDLNGKISVKTTADIAAGEELCIAYAPLYVPSFDRRYSLFKQWHFDPIQAGRYEPQARVKSDYNIGGAKCTKCDQPTNYHQVKHLELPQQNSIVPAPVEEPEKKEGTDDVNTTTTTTTTTPETSAAPTSTSKWLDAAMTKPQDMTVATCYGCGNNTQVIAIDNFIRHCLATIDNAQMQAIQEPHKFLDAQKTLLNIVSYSKTPETKPTDEDHKNAQVAYLPQNLQYTTQGNKRAPTVQLVKFTPTHQVMYKAYKALLHIAVQYDDYTNIYKWAQLLLVCLNGDKAYQNTNEYASILEKMAQSQLFLSGSLAEVLPQEGKVGVSQKMLIPAQMKQDYNLKAYEYYKKVYALRKMLYSPQHPYALVVATAISRLKGLIPKDKL